MTDAIDRATHSLSEYLNDNAPIGEAMYAHPARAALTAALHNPKDPDWLARRLAALDDTEHIFDTDIPEFLSKPVEKIRNQYRRQVNALLDEILGEK